MKGHPILYTTAELAWVQANRALPIADLHAGFVAMFGRPDVTRENLHSLRKRKGWLTGRTGQFVKGEAPHNKGVPCAPDQGGRHPNSRAHQFRKGERRGRALQNFRPIGTERVTEEGYLERKVNEDMPFHRRWRLIHVLNWEAANGPIPPGHALKCLDCNKVNVDPANWQLVSRAVLVRLNGGRFKHRLAFDQAPAELKPTLMAMATLDQRVKAARKA